jgi:TnpA family transposase
LSTDTESKSNSSSLVKFQSAQVVNFESARTGLNKGEARNALARAVFFNRLGEIRDRSFEQQRYRASGLNLVTAAIVLWNTVYLERATNAIREITPDFDENLLQHGVGVEKGN